MAATMGKRLKGRKCVYCATAVADTEDHLFSREFFLLSDRANLPKVPACNACNNAKSRLEHYATAVLGFGGRHPGAKTNLETMVPKRLRRNNALFKELKQGVRRAWTKQSSGLIVPTMMLTVDYEKIRNLFCYLAEGLIWQHWKTYLRSDDTKQVMFLTSEGDAFFRKTIGSCDGARVSESLGNGTILYEGVQDLKISTLTMWRISIYGGFQFSDERIKDVGTTVGIVTWGENLPA